MWSGPGGSSVTDLSPDRNEKSVSEGGDAERDLRCIFKVACFSDWCLNHTSGKLRALLRFEAGSDLGLGLGLGFSFEFGILLYGELDILFESGVGIRLPALPTPLYCYGC